MKNKLSLITLIGLVLGIIFGLVFPEHTQAISFIGTYYITILKYMIVPVVFTSISVSIYNSKNFKDSLVIKTVLVFIAMFVSTFILSSIVVTIINPASGFQFENVEWTGETTQISISSILINLIPKDLKKFLTGSNLFFVILMSVIFGLLCTKIKGGDKAIEFIIKVKELIFKVLEIYMYVTPFASFSLISNTVAKYGSILVGVGFKYILTAYISSLCAVIVVMVLPVLIICKMSPATFIKKVYKIWTITVSTCSSAATLPYTIKTCKEEFNIPEKITDVVVPLGCTIHMCGGAVSFSLLGLFCAKLYGITVTPSMYLLMVVSATLINMAAPGIPNGGVVIGATYLQLLGIPLDFIGFYSGIYKLLDMVYTSLNVTDDIAANVIINKLCSK